MVRWELERPPGPRTVVVSGTEIEIPRDLYVLRRTDPDRARDIVPGAFEIRCRDACFGGSVAQVQVKVEALEESALELLGERFATTHDQPQAREAQVRLVEEYRQHRRYEVGDRDALLMEHHFQVGRIGMPARAHSSRIQPSLFAGRRC